MDHLPSDKERIFGHECEVGLHPQPGEYISYFKLLHAAPAYLEAEHKKGFLLNGARLYPDQHKNVEYATPECLRVYSLLVAHLAGEEIVAETINNLYGHEEDPQKRVYGYKRTIDQSMETRGDHENYLTGKKDLPEVIGKYLLPHLCTRLIYSGPGMIKQRRDKWEYVLDQKIWGMGGEPIGALSTSNRFKPFILTRHEPFDRTGSTNRLQIISGSANMFPFPIYARFLTTSLVLRMIEAKTPLDDLLVHNAFAASRAVSRDLDLKGKVYLEDGRKLTAPQLQHELAMRALKLSEQRELPAEEAAWAPIWARLTSDLLEKRFDPWLRHIEWLAKLHRIERKRESGKFGLGSPEIVEDEIKWHRLGENSIIDQYREKGAVAMLPSATEIADALNVAPDNTRARVRGRFQAEHKNHDEIEVNWDTWTDKKKMPSSPIIVSNAYQGLDEAA